MKRVYTLFFICMFYNWVYSQCPPSVSIVKTSLNEVCIGESIPLSLVVQNGGAFPKYAWVVDGDTVANTASYTPVIDESTTLTVYLETSNVCSDPIAQDVITINPVELEIRNNVVIETCDQTTFDVQLSVNGGDEPYLYQVNEVEQLDRVFYSLEFGDYVYVIKDANNCSDTAMFELTPELCPPLNPLFYITPNDDGYNDSWIIYNIQYYPENEVFIYDKWGQRVYHTNDYDNAKGWEARYLGVRLPVSTYFYLIKYADHEGEKTLTGPISLLR